MLFGYRLPHTLNQRVEIRRRVTLELLHDHQPLSAFHIYRESHAAAAPQISVTLPHRLLDVLRIEIAAADDDQIFQTPGNEQLAVMQEPEISGAQERFARHAGEARAKDVLRLFRPLPVTFRHALARDPDFTNFTRRAWHFSFRVNDQCFLITGGRTAAHQFLYAIIRRLLFDAM